MKQIKFIAAAIAALAALWACQPDEPEVVVKASVSVSPTSVSFEADGGTFRVAVDTNQDSFSVSGVPGWLKAEQSGKEIVLTAEENTVNEARACTLTVTAGDATASIEVTQKAGSPYKGYTVCNASKLEYGGTMLYQFMKPTEEDYGGWGMLSLTDEDGNILDLWIYTDLFQSEEEIELTTGTYVKGNDDYLGLQLAAKKLTFMPGIHTGEDDDDYVSGSYYSSIVDGKDFAILDGTLEVSKEGDGYLIVADMTDETGAARKCVYTGDVEIDASGAAYPGTGDRIDVANTVFAAQCYYMGDVAENGTTQFNLNIYSGDYENYAVTSYVFYTDAVEYSEDIDISGIYKSPDESEEAEDPVAPQSAGSIDFGELFEFGDFSFPFGTYVMYSYGDYLIGDAFNSLVLSKAEDGTYTIEMGIVTSANGEYVFFMGITGLEIPIIDGRDNGEED